MGNFDSVFDTSTNLEQKWDTVFDAEEDSTLMDIVAGMSPKGYNEGAGIGDIGGESDPGPGNDSKNKPSDDSANPGDNNIMKDPANKIKDGGESEADKWHNDEDEEYQDGKAYGSKEPDPENILGWQTKNVGLKEGGEDCDPEDCDDEDLVSGMDDDDSDEDEDDEEDDDDDEDDDEDLDEGASLDSEKVEDQIIDSVENSPEPDKDRLKKDLALSDDDDELIDTVLGEN